MTALGRELRQESRVYFVGGVSAVLCGWRESTIDVDVKIVPDAEAFAVLSRIKESESINIEFASPLDFLPALPGWEERSVFLRREGQVSFFHFDFYSQALAKVERGFDQDLRDVQAMVQRGLVVPGRARELFERIVPELVRFPAVDPRALRALVDESFPASASPNAGTSAAPGA